MLKQQLNQLHMPMLDDAIEGKFYNLHGSCRLYDSFISAIGANGIIEAIRSAEFLLPPPHSNQAFHFFGAWTMDYALRHGISPRFAIEALPAPFSHGGWWHMLITHQALGPTKELFDYVRMRTTYQREFLLTWFNLGHGFGPQNLDKMEGKSEIRG